MQTSTSDSSPQLFFPTSQVLFTLQPLTSNELLTCWAQQQDIITRLALERRKMSCCTLRDRAQMYSLFTRQNSTVKIKTAAKQRCTLFPWQQRHYSYPTAETGAVTTETDLGIAESSTALLTVAYSNERQYWLIDYNRTVDHCTAIVLVKQYNQWIHAAAHPASSKLWKLAVVIWTP